MGLRVSEKKTTLQEKQIEIFRSSSKSFTNRPSCFNEGESQAIFPLIYQASCILPHNYVKVMLGQNLPIACIYELQVTSSPSAAKVNIGNFTKTRRQKPRVFRLQEIGETQMQHWSETRNTFNVQHFDKPLCQLNVLMKEEKRQRNEDK